MTRCVLGLGVQVYGLPGRVLRCGNVAAHRVMLCPVPGGVSNRNLLPAAQWCPCLSGGCGVRGMCYGLRLLGAVYLYGRSDVFRLEGGVYAIRCLPLYLALSVVLPPRVLLVPS